uniref:Uncharacterized protein n=1 Tax=Poecilia mexicana TaxID=48701 RepID=A0A3B3YQZ5_9TELE
MRRVLQTHPWYTAAVLGTISLVITWMVFGLDKRSSNNQQPVLTLNYYKGSDTAFKFDLCDIIDCGGNPLGWKSWEVHLCMSSNINRCYEACENGWCPYCQLCPSWDRVTHYTGAWWTPTHSRLPSAQVNKISFSRLYSHTDNPLILALHDVHQSLYDGNPDRMYIVLGVEASGGDPLKVILINLLTPPKNDSDSSHEIKDSGFLDKQTGNVITFDYSKLTPADVLMLATGYTGTNLWLDWLTATVREHHMSNCVACAAGRPKMYTEPAPLIQSDAWGFNCMFSMTKMRQPSGCENLTALFPPVNNKTRMVPAIPVKDNYVCFNLTKGNVRVGQIDASWCKTTLPGHLIGTWARDGLFYLCGGSKLFARLEPTMRGVCAMVRLRAHVIMMGEKQPVEDSMFSRKKRSAFDLQANSPTYIDSIGVPRGVPDRYKLADQVAAGFESLLLFITPNKNVDRINYIHYNTLVLTNLTRDAVEGLAGQLAPTSLMTVQNRIAIDMILAEKGGVCAIFGDLCCVFVPNHTSPDGKVTKALEGLKALSKTMHEQSGVTNPLDQWFTNMFGKYKGIIISLLISTATFLALLITCGCCCVPCLRSLAVRCITSTIEKGSSSDGNPPAYQMFSRRRERTVKFQISRV